MAGEPVYGSDKTRAKIEAVTLSARFPRLDKRVPLIVPSGPLVVQHHRLHRAKGMYSVADLEAAEAWLQELDTKAQDVADRRLRKRIKQAGAAVAAAKRVRAPCSAELTAVARGASPDLANGLPRQGRRFGQ